MKNVVALALLLLPAAQDPDPRATVEALQRRIALLGGGEQKSDLDPAALAASLGHDPDRLFKFAQALPLHPYSGALRGATGALLAGAANDVDRCLLLKELLQSGPARPAVRFAFGDLTEAQAGALAARTLRSVPGLPGTRLAQADVLARVGGTEEAVAAAQERMRKAAEPRVKSFEGGFAADRTAIDEALKGAGIVLAGAPRDGLAAAAGSLRRHVWLQVEREGKWIDLDPTFPEAAGWAPVAPAGTADVLPAASFHRLTLRLFVERRDGARLDTEAVYAATRPVAEFAGRAINISVLPADYDAEKSAEPLEKQAMRFTQFQPVVDFGGGKENARVFDVQGRVHASKDGKLGAGNAAGNRVLGAMGRKPTALSAVYLEIELEAPDRRHVERRYLLDRLKPGTRPKSPDWDERWADDARFRIALFKSWTIWPAAGMLNDAFLFDRLARLLATDGGLPRLLFDAAPPKAGQVAERLDPLPLGLVEVWQSALRLAQGSFAPGDGSCFPDGASLLMWKEELTLGEGGKLGWRGGVDLVHVPLGCVAKSPAAAARARLLFGLLLSEGESSLMEGRPGVLFSAAAVFRKAREEKIPLALLRGSPEGVELDAATAEHLRRDLAAGRVVLIPKQSLAVGGRKATAWWRIDPATGDCLGIGDTGEGQAVSEGVLILEKISIPMVQRCMKFVVCLNLAIGAGRSMQDAGRECMTEFMRDYIKDTVDGAIDHFVKDPLKAKAKKSVKGGAGMMDPELAALYEKAEETWGVANEAIDDLTFSGLRAKVAILLDMGSDIAKYANEKAR